MSEQEEMKEEKEIDCEGEPNCPFYKTHYRDNSRIGHIPTAEGSKRFNVYCVVQECSNYSLRETPIQFDDDLPPNYMRRCLSNAKVVGGTPSDRKGKPISGLEEISGVRA
jgi:hypothetical protein